MSQKVVKKHKNNNHYLLTSNGYWIRDFNNKIAPLDINHKDKKNEYSLFVENQLKIDSYRISPLESNILPTHEKIMIVSDGMEFDKFKTILPSIPKDIHIIGINRSLAKWPVNNSLPVRRMNYFINNNPFSDAVSYLPKHDYWPNCLISLRSNAEFAKKYKGNLWYYEPVPEKEAQHNGGKGLQIDEYRNPVCTAIGIASLFKVNKLALVCCDDSFKTTRPSAIQLKNSYWMYPQHQISHEFIDGSLYWLKQNEDRTINAINCSCGPEYNNAEYICMESLMEFFNE